MAKLKRSAQIDGDRLLRNKKPTLASPLKAKDKAASRRPTGKAATKNKNSKQEDTAPKQKSNVERNTKNNKITAVPGCSTWSPNATREAATRNRVVDRRSIRNILHSKLSRVDKAASKDPVAIKNIEFAMDNSLRYTKKGGIEYAIYPLTDPIHKTGLVKIRPGGLKKLKKTVLNMKYTVILGSTEFMFEDKVVPYKQQDVVSVPTGIRYGIKNRSNQNCVLTFFTHC